VDDFSEEFEGSSKVEIKMGITGLVDFASASICHLHNLAVIFIFGKFGVFHFKNKKKTSNNASLASLVSVFFFI